MPNVMSKPKRTNKVILGIDHGTTNTRACLLDPRTRLVRWAMEDSDIMLKVSYQETDRTFFPAFSSILNQKYPNLAGAEAALWPDRVPLKIMALVLDKTDDDVTGKPRHEILKSMPHGAELYRLRNDPEFNGLVKQHWIKHFEHVKASLDHVCEWHNLEISEIVVSLPNWASDEAVEYLYMDIVASVFGKTIKMNWVGEAEAISHKIVHSDLRRLEGRTTLLVIDLGGTSLNGCLMEIFRPDDEDEGDEMDQEEIKPVSMAQLESFGEIGGGEKLEMGILSAFRRNLKLAPGCTEANTDVNEVLKHLLASFRPDRCLLDPMAEMHYSAPIHGTDRSHRVALTGPEVEAVFDEAFLDCLKLVGTKLRNAALQHGGNLAVVFSGGSTKIKHIRLAFQAFVDELNDELEPDQPIVCKFSVTFNGWDNRDGIVAEGAAIAAMKARAKSLTTMVANGAKFGVQFRDVASPDGGNGDVILPLYGAGVPDNTKGAYYAQGQGLSRRLAIVCDAFMASKRPDGVYMDTRHCYDLFVAPAADTDRRGRYAYKLWRPDDGRDLLRFQLDHQWGPRRERKIYDLPLYLDTGSSCVLVDEEGVPDDAEWRRLPGSK